MAQQQQFQVGFGDCLASNAFCPAWGDPHKIPLNPPDF